VHCYSKNYLRKGEFKLGNILYKILNTIVIIQIIIITVAVNLGVLYRYILKNPLIWSFDLSTLLFAYSIFLGLILSIKEQALIGIDYFINKLSCKAKAKIKIINNVIILIISFYLTYQGIILTTKTGMQLTTFRISIRWLYISLPLGFGFLSLYLLTELKEQIRLLLLRGK
jgi:TRAP-type C4-dicarboxylate transport system permease small subunit